MEPPTTLSKGALLAICNGTNNNNDEETPPPILQVADVRLVNSQSSNTSGERYRILLSDGVHLQQGMLATQRNELVRSGRLQKGSIVKLVQFVCNDVQQRKIIIIIEIEVLKEVCPPIGEPQALGGPRPPQTQVSGPTGMAMPGNVKPGNPNLPANGPVSRPGGANSLEPRPEHGGQVQSYGAASATNLHSGPTIYPKQEYGTGSPGNTVADGTYGGFNNGRGEVPRAPANTYARPQPVYQQPAAANPYARPQQPGCRQPAPANPYARPQQAGYQQPAPMYMNRGPIAKNEAPPRVIPIAALNPYQNRWTIKARVTAKSELKRYSNARGDGKVFSFDLLDSGSGEIRATCFNAVADQFYDQIEIGKVYFISKGTLKPAQKNFNHLPNDHEISLDITSVIQPCPEDDSTIPGQQFHFRPIGDIESLENGSIMDLIGVVFSISPSSSIMRKNGTETLKRNLHLKDMSGKSVELTMWGNFCNAEGQTLQNTCDSGHNPVLAVKAGRISEFNGKAVGTISSSQLFIEPDFPEAHRLREWYETEGRNAPTVSISRETTSMGRTDVRKTISQIKDEKLGTSEKPDWITVCATISYIKVDNFCYTACPIQIADRQCNKKVTDNGDGKWRCDRCDQSVDKCDYRYILQFQIQDHTGLTWVTAFQESGEEILGVPAKELYLLKHEEQDEERVTDIIQAALSGKYIFKLKVKEETYSDEQRVKSTATKAERLNFSSESRFLVDLMQKLKTGASGQLTPKAENNPNVGISRSGALHVGLGQPAGSGVSYGTNSNLVDRDMGISCSNTNQYGNQYSGGYGGPNASVTYLTCSSCGGEGHNSATCPSIINGPAQSSTVYDNPASRACFKCKQFGHFSEDCPVPPAHGGSNFGPGRYGSGRR